jgi:hypothetical protein
MWFCSLGLDAFVISVRENENQSYVSLLLTIEYLAVCLNRYLTLAVINTGYVFTFEVSG